MRDKETLAKVTRGKGSAEKGQQLIEPLLLQAAASAWPTPAARDTRSESCSDVYAEMRNAETRGKPLTWAVCHENAGARNYGDLKRSERTCGLRDPASSSTTGSRPASSPVVMNPAWVEALMGFPPGWTDVPVPTAGNGCKR